MIGQENRIVFPEGDSQVIEHTLTVNQLVDVNGIPLALPLATDKMIAFKVYKIATRHTRNDEIREFYLELLSRAELTAYSRINYR